MGRGVGVLNRDEGLNKSCELQTGTYKGEGINSAFTVSHPNCQPPNSGDETQQTVIRRGTSLTLVCLTFVN